MTAAPAAGDPPHYVVVGSGYTGGRVLASLQRGGAAATLGLRRSAAPSGGRHRLLPLDLDCGDARLPPLPAPYALLYTVPPARDADTDIRLDRLLSILEPVPRRVVYLSTSGVYGDRGGRLVDEGTPPEPATPRAARRLAAERQLESWSGERGVELVVLRVPGIYGPGRLGLEGIRAGSPGICEAEAHPGNRIHVDDLTACCVQALAAGPPGLYNVSDGDHRSASWFRSAVARLAGLPEPPVVTREQAERRFSAARWSFLRESRRLDNRKMREVLGVEPRFADAEDGIRDALAAEGLPANETETTGGA